MLFWEKLIVQKSLDVKVKQVCDCHELVFKTLFVFHIGYGQKQGASLKHSKV